MARVILLAACFFVSAFSAAGQATPVQQIETTNKSIAVAMQKNDLKTATTLAREAVVLTESHFGPKSRYTAISYENLGTILAGDNKHKLAVEPFKKAFDIFREDPASAADATKILGKLANAQLKSGQSKEAEATLLDYRSRADTRFGPRSRESLQARTALACFYQTAKQPVKAMDEYVEAYAAALNTFGRESKELDQVGIACEGSFMELFWSNQDRLNPARRKLNELLGYEMGRPTSLRSADQSIPFPARPIDVTIHSVVVKVWVDEKGSPSDAKLVFGESRFNDLATSSVKESKFRPSQKNGVPISDVMYFAYTFIRR
jgi:tetratricopeptide (TPR) repeat protein